MGPKASQLKCRLACRVKRVVILDFLLGYMVALGLSCGDLFTWVWGGFGDVRVM